MSSLPQLLAYTHHPGYLTANINDALKNVTVHVPDLETLIPSDLKPTVPYDEIPIGKKRKRSGNVKRLNSRGEVFLNQIRSKRAKMELANARPDMESSPDYVQKFHISSKNTCLYMQSFLWSKSTGVCSFLVACSFPLIRYVNLKTNVMFL